MTQVMITYYSLTGNTKSIADKIRKKTRSDMFEIQTVKTYPTDYSALSEEAKRELQSGDLPALKKSPPDLSSYDLILVGSPVWWHTVSAPVMSFLDRRTSQVRRLEPFVPTREGSGNFSPISRSRLKMPSVLKVSISTTPDRTEKERSIRISIPGLENSRINRGRNQCKNVN